MPLLSSTGETGPGSRIGTHSPSVREGRGPGDGCVEPTGLTETGRHALAPAMTRVPKTRTRLKKSKPNEAVFLAAPGPRRLAGALCGVIALLFVVHQTQIEGEAIWFRLFAALMAVFFGGLGWYFWRRGSRKGPVLRIGKDGFGIAVGFKGWLEFPWEEVEAFRYWEPTGLAILIKRRQSRWVGVLVTRKLRGDDLSWDQRFELWLNTFHNRPGLCVLHPFVQAPILDVLQAFKDFGPRRADDYNWMSR